MKQSYVVSTLRIEKKSDAVVPDPQLSDNSTFVSFVTESQ